MTPDAENQCTGKLSLNETMYGLVKLGNNPDNGHPSNTPDTIKPVKKNINIEAIANTTRCALELCALELLLTNKPFAATWMLATTTNHRNNRPLPTQTANSLAEEGNKIESGQPSDAVNAVNAANVTTTTSGMIMQAIRNALEFRFIVSIDSTIAFRTMVNCLNGSSVAARMEGRISRATPNPGSGLISAATQTALWDGNSGGGIGPRRVLTVDI